MVAEFEKFEKIETLGKTKKTLGILQGLVQALEKLDGACTAIYCDSEPLRYSSRNQFVQGFRGFQEYVENHPGLLALCAHPEVYKVRGEWLVKHSVPYAEEDYKVFYVYAIDLVKEDGTVYRASWRHIEAMSRQYHFATTPLLGEFMNPTIEDLRPLVGTTKLGGEFGEGIVINNDSSGQKAKWVSEKFAEVSANKVKQPKERVVKSSINLQEWAKANCNARRVEKIWQKYCLENDLDMTEDLSKRHTGKILPLCVQDTVEEELEPYLEANPSEFIDEKELHKAISSVAKDHFFAMMTI